MQERNLLLAPSLNVANQQTFKQQRKKPSSDSSSSPDTPLKILESPDVSPILENNDFC
jgi:hypothetical protein